MKKHSQVLVYNPEFSNLSYGSSHPLKMERLKLTVDLMDAYGLFDSQESPWVEAKNADEQDLHLVHTPEYLDCMIGHCWSPVRLWSASDK